MKIKELIALLKSDGWHQVRQKGSHRQFHHPALSMRKAVCGLTFHPPRNEAGVTLKNLKRLLRFVNWTVSQSLSPWVLAYLFSA
ncbi:MAG: addiction module toxin, HicA family [Candidatus Electrothrix sp. MAN1_4]|nr:addiction module toxin, HicA family [Candidatus Electrothrix sp. MAN1_4]